jgi:hypothetical protein
VPFPERGGAELIRFSERREREAAPKEPVTAP